MWEEENEVLDYVYDVEKQRKKAEIKLYRIILASLPIGLKIGTWKETKHLLSPPKYKGTRCRPPCICFFLSPFCELSRLFTDFLHTFIRKFAKGILLRHLSLYPWRPSVMFLEQSAQKYWTELSSCFKTLPLPKQPSAPPPNTPKECKILIPLFSL